MNKYEFHKKYSDEDPYYDSIAERDETELYRCKATRAQSKRLDQIPDGKLHITIC